MALSLISLTLLSLVSFVGGPQQSRHGGTPAETQVSAPVAGGADAGTQTAQPQTAQPLTAADKAALRRVGPLCEQAVRTARLAGI